MKNTTMIKKQITLFCLVFISLLTLTFGRAGATTIVPRNFDDLTREADLVFVGTVEEMYSEWDGEMYRSEIYTYVTFSDLEIISGDHNAGTIQIRISGGDIHGHVIDYPGVPRFHGGERNL